MPDALTSSPGPIDPAASGSQEAPAATVLSNGDRVVVWESSGGPGDSGFDVRGQLYAPDGSAIGSSFLVNSAQMGDQSSPEVMPLANGGFLVTFTAKNGPDTADVMGQAFSATGQPVGSEFRVNSANGYDQTIADAAPLTGGGSVQAWYSATAPENQTPGHAYPSPPPPPTVLAAQVLDGSGAAVGPQIEIADAVNAQDLHVAGLANGGFLAVWRAPDANGQFPVLGQIYDASGHTVGAQMTLESTGAVSPSIAGLPDGGFVLAYSEMRGDGGDIFVQRFTADGTKLGPEHVVESERFWQGDPKVVATPDGGYMVAFWSDAMTPDQNASPVWHLFAQRFDAHDNAVGGPLQLDNGGGVALQDIATSMNPAGQALVLWDGVAAGQVEVDGRLIAANTVGTTDPNAGQVLTTNQPNVTLTGGAGDDTLANSSGPDVLTGGAGADVFLFNQAPWAPTHITDFQVGVDRLDLMPVLRAVGYVGDDPIRDHYVTLADDGHGGTEVLFDADGSGTAQQWPNYIIDIENVPVANLTWFDLNTGAVPPTPGETTIGSPPPPPASPPPVSPPPVSGGQTLQAHDGGSTLVGGSGDDTLIGAHGPDQMTGNAGADQFTFNEVPWQGAMITDFTVGTDHIDLRSLLQQAGYAGSDPVGDGYVKFLDDGHGDTWLYFDPTPSSNPWGDYIATIQGVAPSSLSDASLTGFGGTASPPPPPASPPPVSPPPASGGQTLQAQDGGSTLVGGSGNDTLIGAHGPDQMTGNAGADHFVFNEVPWQGAQITDFTPGTDKVDLTSLLHQAGYSGSDPVADGYVKFLDDGHGDTWLYFDPTPSSDPWGDYVATLQHVAPSSLSVGDIIWH